MPQSFQARKAMQNYIDSDVRQEAAELGLDANQTWERRVVKLARMLARTLSENESNSESYKIKVPPVGDDWLHFLTTRLARRTEYMSKEEFLGQFEEDEDNG